MTFADQLARMRVAVSTGCLPDDLGRWALATLAELGPDTERIVARDALLCEAAALLPGSTWAKARALRAEILATDRRRGAAGEIRDLVAAALDIDPGCPRSLRQLLRIVGDNEAIEMSPRAGERW